MYLACYNIRKENINIINIILRFFCAVFIDVKIKRGMRRKNLSLRGDFSILLNKPQNRELLASTIDNARAINFHNAQLVN